MTDRKEFRELAPPDRAHEVLAGLDITPEPERVPLEAATGRVLAERVDAPIDVPGFDRAAVDGYAVRAADTFAASETEPARLRVADAVHAGERPETAVEPGTCVEVATGAVVPPGADAVVMVEDTDPVRESGESGDGAGGGDDASGSGDEAGGGDTDRIAVRTALAPGDGIGFAGADVAAGERALGPGTRLTPREIGTLSALGSDEVPVRGKPTVGILSTGGELVRPGDSLDPAAGQIYDVNSHAIAAGVETAGGEARVYPHAGDDRAELERTLTEAADECDLVVTSGSTSAGALDVLYRVIEERGERLLHGVAIKPGKPTLIGRIDDAGYVGLPGYPVSALVIFRVFVAPVVRRAAGRAARETATATGRMARRVTYEPGRRRLVPVGLVETGVGERLVYPVDKGSGATTSLTNADGFVTLAADDTAIPEGASVSVELFAPDTRPPSLLAVGEDDPAFARLLDRYDTPGQPGDTGRGAADADSVPPGSARYLTRGSRAGRRWLRDEITDCAVLAGPTGGESPGVELASYDREWGLLVPAGNPKDVTGLADLIDRNLRFVNRDTNAGLRTSLGDAVARLADERGVERHSLVDAIDGFDAAVRAHESPARRVLRGEADAGLGLAVTSERLDVGFVPLGTQRVRVVADDERLGKPGVARLRGTLAGLDAVLDALDGYAVAGERAEPE